jgi:hypothetical protein
VAKGIHRDGLSDSLRFLQKILGGCPKTIGMKALYPLLPSQAIQKRYQGACRDRRFQAKLYAYLFADRSETALGRDGNDVCTTLAELGSLLTYKVYRTHAACLKRADKGIKVAMCKKILGGLK